jgi:hypothetical protein
MKVAIHHIIFTLTLAVITPSGIVCSNAQDAGFFNENANESEERMHYGPGGEGEPASASTVRSHATLAPRDSAATTRTLKILTPTTTTEAAKSVSRQSEEEDDSVLSFNFLYYIIRKYKLQDIMD